MPKENINDMVTDGFRVEVGWGSAVPGEREGHVQVAATNAHSLFRWEQLDRAEDEGADPSVGGQFDGWHVTLDREGINRLIRVLRRARDAAYGADA